MEDDGVVKIQVYISIGEKTKGIIVSENCEVDYLIEQVCKKWLASVQPANLMLNFTGIPLAFGLKNTDGSKKRINDKDLQVRRGSTLVVVMGLMGGIWPLKAIKENLKFPQLQPLPGYITITTLPSEPDMISFDDSSDTARAKMPCGHVIGSDSMTNYVESLLSEGKCKFYCPHVDASGKSDCNREWEWFLVRHVACLDQEECEKIEKKISENYLNKAAGIQKCPGCQIWCSRLKPTDNRVRCSVCTKTKERVFEFCWSCLEEWFGEGKVCGNPECDGRDRRIRILAECGTKDIKGKQCPSIRGCPKCGILIEHKEACSHMDCFFCKYSFCFICLKSKDERGKWKCDGFGKCKLEQRQTTLPGSS